MRKTLSVILSISLAFSVMALPIFAADTSTSASVPAETPAAPAAPAKPPVSAPAPAAKNATVDTSKLAAGTYYTVVSGDVFWKIAAKHGMSVDALAKLNPQIKNINLIYPGDKIIVKSEASASTSASTVSTSKKLYHGIGLVANYRVRNGNNDNLNITTASAMFDESGKIVDIEWDVLEITPTLFPGWLDPAAEQSVKDVYIAAQDHWNWETKREEGYDYDMTHKKAKGAADNLSQKEWFEQLDHYEKFFTGKTVAEVVDWFNKYCGADGRPYKLAYLDKLTDEQKAAIPTTFTEAEKKMLVDVTTGATMALKDVHSDFITSLVKAWEDKKEVK